MIRTGTVSSIDEEMGTMRVLFEEQDQTVTEMLPCLSHISSQGLPAIGSRVVVADLDNSSAVILGVLSYKGGA